MLKCNIKRKGHVSVKATGTADDLMVETAALIGEVYRGIRKQDPDAASAYRKRLLTMLLDPKSPVWKEA